MATAYDLMIAPNGARRTKADHPALPVTPQELAIAAQACEAEGANAIHLHVRDRLGRHSLDPDLYADAAALVARHTKMSIQISTESAGIYEVADQRNCLQYAPAQDASIALREILRAPQDLPGTYALAQARGIDVQHIVYSPQDLTLLLQFWDRGEIPALSRRVIFVLGRYTADQTSQPQDLKPFLTALGDQPATWSVCAFGRSEHTCLLTALDAGGHVRLGFENNMTDANGTPFADNAASVAAFVKAAARRGFHPKGLPT
jgi:uncharacterized protein (DUF849 family)